MADFERFAHYLVRVRMRKTSPSGTPLKLGAVLADELKLRVIAGWQCEPGEMYAGEWALCPTDEQVRKVFHEAGIGWLASGDVEVLEQIDGEPTDG